MTLPLLLTPAALHDVEVAYDWYEDLRQGLGDELLGCLDAINARIQRHPELGILLRGMRSRVRGCDHSRVEYG